MGRTLLNHSREVVSAMVYLSMRGYIHRDLAARNILVSKEGICKVSNYSKQEQKILGRVKLIFFLGIRRSQILACLETCRMKSTM